MSAAVCSECGVFMRTVRQSDEDVAQVRPDRFPFHRLSRGGICPGAGRAVPMDAAKTWERGQGGRPQDAVDSPAPALAAVCPQPGDDRCLDQTPCPDCVSLGRPLPLEPYDGFPEEQHRPIYVSGDGAA